MSGNGRPPIQFVMRGSPRLLAGRGDSGAVIAWRPVSGPAADWLSGHRPRIACECRGEVGFDRKCPHHGPALCQIGIGVDFVRACLEEIEDAECFCRREAGQAKQIGLFEATRAQAVEV